MIDPDQAAESQVLIERDQGLEAEVRQLVGMYHASGDETERDKLRGQVKELVSQQFALRHKRRTLELEDLEARVKKLREALSKRESAKQTIVDRHLAELLHDDDGLGWGEAGPDWGGGWFSYSRSGDVLPATVPVVQPRR